MGVKNTIIILLQPILSAERTLRFSNLSFILKLIFSFILHIFTVLGTRQTVISSQNNRVTTRRPSQNMIPQAPVPESTSQAANDDETTTTTRVPPRDPTNRIVYIVSCPCPFTYQYNPVCGTDGQTYGNMGVIQCARSCGTGTYLFYASL